MTLLWGTGIDRPLCAVRLALRQMSIPVVMVDQRSVLTANIDLAVNGCITGQLRIYDDQIDLQTIDSAYLRPYDSRLLPEVNRSPQAQESLNHAMLVDNILASWAEVTPALVINRLSAMAANNSKPYQASWIESFGFFIPETLITTDPAAVRQFSRNHRSVIYKSLSATRSVVSSISQQDECRFDDVAWCPTQFQEYIPGTDYRVHIVGEETFACEIYADSIDYRYADRVEIASCDLPEEIADRCRKMTHAMNLLVAGIDLRRTPNDAWYCFEVNPSPGFTYFQNATGQPIAEAIAHLLSA